MRIQEATAIRLAMDYLEQQMRGKPVSIDDFLDERCAQIRDELCMYLETVSIEAELSDANHLSPEDEALARRVAERVRRRLWARPDHERYPDASSG